MIDLDQLDAQLERALTDDVRAMRNSPPRPRFDHSRPMTLAMVPSGPRTLAEKLASIGDDLDTYPPAPLFVDDEDEVEEIEVEIEDEIDEVDEMEVVDEVETVAGPSYDGELEAVLDEDEDEEDAEAAFEADFDFEYDLVAPEPEPDRPARPAAAPAPAAYRPQAARAVMTDPPAPKPPVNRLSDAPFFERRPSEVARSAPRANGAPPAPNMASARERLRQAAVRQAFGMTDDGSAGISGLAARIPGLLAQGLLDDLDRDLKAHAALAARTGSSDDRLAAAVWKVMRDALDGRADEARSALQVVHALGHGDDRYWAQRFWLAAEWGDEDEQFAVLQHCWERAYRFDDLAWRGALCLLLARMGRTEEAGREVDAVLAGLQGRTPEDLADIVTNLAEAVFVLGDRTKAAALQRLLPKVRDHLVVTGAALACKGALTRFQAHVAWASGNAAAADRHFAAAAETHRALGARPLLARTLREWGATLAGRDDVRAHRCLDESAAIARELGLALAPPAAALAG